jgi:hypothetical protein
MYFFSSPTNPSHRPNPRKPDTSLQASVRAKGADLGVYAQPLGVRERAFRPRDRHREKGNDK